MKLIRRNGPLPPNGYEFKDSRTGMAFPGMEGTFSDQVAKIISHRMANKKLYPASERHWTESDSVAKELDEFTCARLGGNATYCTDGKPITAGQETRTCTHCGAEMLAKICGTCSGNKILGWKCTKCGLEKPK